MTWVPDVYGALQVVPQFRSSGFDVTRPVPVLPVLVMEIPNTCGPNVALTFCP